MSSQTHRNPKQSEGTTILFAVIAPSLWATSFLAVKYIVQNIPPFTAAAFRFVVVTLVAWVLLLLLDRKAKITIRDIPLTAAAGFFQTTLYFAFQYWGLMFTTASNGAILANTRPIFIALIAILFFGEIFNWRKVAGIAIAFLGVVLIVGQGSFITVGTDSEQFKGDLFLLFTAVSGAIGLVLTKRVLGRFGPLATLTYINTFGALGLLPFAGWELFRGVTINSTSLLPWLAPVYQALFTTIVAHFMWNQVLSRKEASWAAVFLYITPVMTVVLSWIFLNETLTWVLALGGALVVLGTHLVTREGSP